MKLVTVAFFVLILSVSSVWVPEHRCVESTHSGKCGSNKCMNKCSEKPQGRGRCIGNYCLCTYYCNDPSK
ncbi:hypothetical protein ACS0TY_030890 [Phlomoides rotata]